ncbi:MAG: hypothetical protein KDA66_01845 [Planctomycetaceae bacterium]|nr:hypothetical protein [Planctomycetaceae bacterium]
MDSQEAQLESRFGESPSTGSKLGWILGALLLATVAVVVVIRGLPVGGVEEQASVLPQGVDSAEFEAIAQEFRAISVKEPTKEAVLATMAKRALAKGESDKALACLSGIVCEVPRGPAARLQAAEILIERNDAVAAEGNLIACTTYAAADDMEVTGRACSWLVFLYSVELRFEERKEILEQMHQFGYASLSDSKLLHFPHLLIWNSSTARERLNDFIEQNPSDTALLIAKARFQTKVGELDEALSLLTQLRELNPSDLNVHAALLECYFEQDMQEEMQAVVTDAGAFDPTEPWLLTRMRAELLVEDAPNQAAILFRHVLANDPANPEANMGLLRTLPPESDEAAQCKSKAIVLSEIRVKLAAVQEGRTQEIQELVDMCRKAGLNEAANAFATYLPLATGNQQVSQTEAVHGDS